MKEVPVHLAELATWTPALGVWLGESRPALRGPWGSWSGHELLCRAAGAAHFLAEAGVPAGVPVPLLATSSPGAFALVIGGASAGCPMAPLGPLLTASELAPCVAALPATHHGRDVPLLADGRFAPVASDVAERTGRRLVLLADDALLPAADRPADLASPADLDPDALVFVLHTSGTSSRPRPIPYPQGRLAERSRVLARYDGLGPGAVYATGGPFHHVGGIGNQLMALGAGATLTPLPRFTVAAWRELAPYGVTHGILSPTMIEDLLEAGALALPGMHTLVYGSSPIHPDTLDRLLATVPDVELVQMYGQTEASPITVLTGDDHRRAATDRFDVLGTVGRPVDGIDLEIHDPDTSGAGEIRVRSAYFMAPGDGDGWIATGDVGRLLDGYLELVGRLGDTINRGGESIYPFEVEQVLAAHPSVAEAAVVGVPDQRLGEAVKAFLVPADRAHPPDPETLRAHVRASLAGFKVPAQWAVVGSLPRNGAGQVLRRALLHPLTDDDLVEELEDAVGAEARSVTPRAGGHLRLVSPPPEAPD